MNKKLILIALLLSLPLPHLYRAWDKRAWQRADTQQRAADERQRAIYERQRTEAGAARAEADRIAAPDIIPAPAVAPDFALKLFREVAGAEPGKNVFISPAGARWMLGMAYAGAGSATQRQLAEVIGAGAPEQNLRDEAARRASLLGADPGVILKVANGLWLKNGYPFKQGFIAALRDYFSAEVFARDFTGADVAEANAWVSKQTEGKIDSVLGEFKPEERALLVNAVYFKGDWTKPFSERDTKEEPFTLPSGKKEPRRLMYSYGTNDYYQGKDYQALWLPYGNQRLGMIVLLPSRTLGLAGLNARLDPEFWRATLSSMTEQTGMVRLPRFKLEYSIALNDPLGALGLQLPFDQAQADFSGIAELKGPGERLYISGVQQDTFVEVNEKGTEAAAVTRGSFCSAKFAVKAPPPFDFRADRPFLYAIAYRGTGEILFIGALNDPAQK